MSLGHCSKINAWPGMVLLEWTSFNENLTNTHSLVISYVYSYAHSIQLKINKLSLLRLWFDRIVYLFTFFKGLNYCLSSTIYWISPVRFDWIAQTANSPIIPTNEIETDDKSNDENIRESRPLSDVFIIPLLVFLKIFIFVIIQCIHVLTL